MDHVLGDVIRALRNLYLAGVIYPRVLATLNAIYSSERHPRSTTDPPWIISYRDAAFCRLAHVETACIPIDTALAPD